MKKIIFIVSIVIVAFSFSDCQKEVASNSENLDLFSEMEKQCEVIQAELDEYVYAAWGSYNPTRAELIANIDVSNFPNNEQEQQECNLANFEEWMQRYITIYSNDSDISNWDARSVLEEVQKDESLTTDQKILFAQCLSYGYFMTSNIPNVSTRATRSECLDSFKMSVAKICREYFYGSAFAFIMGSPWSLGFVTIRAYYKVDEAEKEYNNCVK